jgi:cobalamin biosynthesis Mg chelatase CobN
MFRYLITVLALVSFGLAQDLSAFPQCSLNCFVPAIQAGGCDLTDYVCQCTKGKSAIAQAATPCIVQSCNPADAAKVQSVSDQFCASVTAGGATGSATPASSGAASKSSSAAAAGTASGASGTASSTPAQQTTNAAPALRLDSVGAAVGVIAVGMLAL